ncbi:hypothetical protein [Kushneria aurantia]|uniref:Uncharacterized protein n=1 Tax=Kushneria aurantia TaxID=504092 RepID=A0ABV6FYT4_9GAMM|nr:hypothetical protein [Kushneria aurantia]
MKKLLGTWLANWLRKPQNRAKAKRTAEQVWNRYQQRKGSSKGGSGRSPRGPR